jgi:purine-nucleoside phosphorylase
MSSPPILRLKSPDEPSVFVVENLQRECRRQRGLAEGRVPRVCVLDPDGDLERYLLASGRATPDARWACYHTKLCTFDEQGTTFGIVGCAVGAPFAVLVAEQMFASGCELVLSITSCGQLAEVGAPPYFILIDRAYRDEGTSYHYLAPSDFVDADPVLIERAERALDALDVVVRRGATWTTDAPFRETENAVATHTRAGLLGVEMEAAALYAFASSKRRAVLCFGQITNRMAQAPGDFEKGDAGGALDALALLRAVAEALIERR